MNEREAARDRGTLQSQIAELYAALSPVALTDEAEAALARLEFVRDSISNSADTLMGEESDNGLVYVMDDALVVLRCAVERISRQANEPRGATSQA